MSLNLGFDVGPLVTLADLEPGTRFIQPGTGTEGKLKELMQGSAAVTVLKSNGKWENTTWSLATRVRRYTT